MNLQTKARKTSKALHHIKGFTFCFTKMKYLWLSLVDDSVSCSNSNMALRSDLPVSLDYMQDDKCQEKTSPILNGCANETTEQTAALESGNDHVKVC